MPLKLQGANFSDNKSLNKISFHYLIMFCNVSHTEAVFPNIPQIIGNKIIIKISSIKKVNIHFCHLTY